ncbi:uncharacterized protein LOC124818989 [Hydra vulgaris]|uniref:uncharacterized protein LOC124818989 n=1 Tax=Hydra vulgaris TaxID=6087 RepID=UPI001F5FE40D|nr:uncharacterized protein LOC124818989 [Hydra vulgaris]
MNNNEEGRAGPQVHIVFDSGPALDRRHYNMPITDEVAAIFVLENNELPPIADEILGRGIAYMGVIEFQKRGLPHCHLVLSQMDANDNIRIPENANFIISAEIPDPGSDNCLHEIVATMRMHGICGTTNANAPCMIHSVCSKRFSKTFKDMTSLDTNGYPEYHRKDTGHCIDIKYGQAYNRWVVPYNKYLLAK